MSLPSGYTQLEYIESSGTQCINTGFYPNQDTGIVIDYQYLTASGWIFGGRTAASDSAFGLYDYSSNGKIYFVYGANQTTFSDADDLSKKTCTVDKNQAIIGDETVTISEQTFTSAATLYLFARNTNGTIGGYASAKLYSCQIYDNGTLVRDFIPCQNASGTVGLWDNVNSVFYANAGSGSFISSTEPKGNHNILLDGASFEITGGRALVDGTGYDIKKGRTLIAGTGYDIKLLGEYTIEVTYDKWTNSKAFAINDTWYGYDQGSSGTATYIAEEGSVLRFESNRDSNLLTQPYISLNGTKVATGSLGVRNYRYTLTGDIKIELKRDVEDLSNAANINYNYFLITEL